MTKKEIAEIKKHTSAKNSTSSGIHGCYVTPSGEIISQFTVKMHALSEEDKEEYFSLFRKILSPHIGKASFAVQYTPQEVQDLQEHKLLMALLDTELKDEETLSRFYEQIIESVQMDSQYLILLDFESYDVPHKRADTGRDSEEVFHYIVCAVCPVSQSKTELSYCAAEKDFHMASAGWAASQPFAGFLFPAFNDRARDIYEALFYAKKADAVLPQMLYQSLFGKPFPQSTGEQRELVADILSETLGPDCTLRLVEGMRQTILANEMSPDREDEPFEVGCRELSDYLSAQNIMPERIAEFQEKFNRVFGDKKLPAESVIETGKFVVHADDFSLTVTPAATSRVSIRTIEGKRYILIDAEGNDVTLNGVTINDQK